jgi:isoleucyl-tRNA synthetase
MKGHRCRWQNSFDCHGLWVEVEVEKALAFKLRDDIEAYGVGHFNDKCRQRVDTFAEEITRQSQRLGQWNHWNNSYRTDTDHNIESIWRFLKVCQEKGLLKKGKRVLNTL